MPKIISDIENKIYEAAFTLFTEKGYDGVNMAMVAKETGIAVGTLYNYHKNKKELFLNVLDKSWQETLCKLNQVLEDEEDEKKLRIIISTLYIHISQKNGLSHELLISSELREVGFKFIRKMRSKIIDMINRALADYPLYRKFEITEAAHKRLIHLIFIEIIDIRREFIDEKEENIEFIINIIDAILTGNT